MRTIYLLFRPEVERKFFMEEVGNLVEYTVTGVTVADLAIYRRSDLSDLKMLVPASLYKVYLDNRREL